MPNLSIHIKTQEKGFQLKGKGIILTYWRSEDRGVITRSLKTRSVHETFLATRSCSDEEMDTESHPNRIEFNQYRDWQALIDDEKKFTDNPIWFDEIAKLQKQYPCFVNSTALPPSNPILKEDSSSSTPGSKQGTFW